MVPKSRMFVCDRSNGAASCGVDRGSNLVRQSILARQVLIVDPGVRLLDTGSERYRGLPAEALQNHAVVAAAAIHSGGSVEPVGAPQTDAGDLFDHVDQPVDGHRLARAEVERYVHLDAHQRAPLPAVAGDFDVLIAADDGGNNLAADRRRRLLAAAVPGAERAVDVVEARDPDLQAEVLREMAAHAFGEELLPAIPVLRHGRVGIVLPQRGAAAGAL